MITLSTPQVTEVTIDTVRLLADNLNRIRDEIESLMLVTPPDSAAVVTVAATQVTEATVGTLSVGAQVQPSPVQKLA